MRGQPPAAGARRRPAGPTALRLRNYSRPFFTDENVRKSITSLASSEEVTIFVGAGVSADQGMLSWSGLVSELIGSQLKSGSWSALPDETLSMIASFAIDTYYQIPTATVIDHFFKESSGDNWLLRRNAALREILYAPPEAPSLPKSPTLVDQIIRLGNTLSWLGRSVHIITTNYDDLFQTAAREGIVAGELASLKTTLKTYADKPPTDDDLEDTDLPLVHIHGYLPRDRSRDRRPLVFSEADYFAWDTESPFREYLLERFNKSTVLMVGTSLRDNNIAAKLWATRLRRSPRYALLSAQEELRAGETLGLEYGARLASLGEMRGHQLGVTVLRPDFHGQVLQYLSEVAHISSGPENPPSASYGERLQSWATRWKAQNYRDPARIKTVTDALEACAADLKSRLSTATAVKVELWVRSEPGNRDIELWCDSRAERRIGAPDYRRHTEPLTALNPHAAVRCFTSHAGIVGRLPQPSHPTWTHHAAVLIEDESFLPVGVVVALFGCSEDSTSPHPRGFLSVWPTLSEKLKAVGEAFLLPGDLKSSEEI